MTSQSRLTPQLKDYRELATSMRPKDKTPSKPPSNKLYERQEGIDRSRVAPTLESRVTPDKYRRDDSRDVLGTRQKDHRITDSLEYKIESILKHNSHLLNENAALSELLTERNTEIEVLQKRLEAQVNEEVNTLNLIEIEKNRFLAEIEEKLRLREYRIDELMEENSRLKDTLVELENLKNRELALQKDELGRQTFDQLDALKRAHMGNVDIYEVQIKKLRQVIDEKQHQAEAQEHENKMVETKLREHVAQLQGELKHANQMRDLELSECKLHYDNVVEKMARETARILEAEKSNHETAIRKLKKELGDRIIEVERLTNKICKSHEDNQAEYGFLNDDKHRVELAMMELETRLRGELTSEKQRLTELNSAEVTTLETKNKHLHDALESENSKIYELCKRKTEEIERLHIQIETLRNTADTEIAAKDKLIEELKAKLDEEAKNNLEEVELLKVKMAQLFNGDVRTLRNYYENQITALNEQIAALNKINHEARETLQRQIEDKSEQRKALELELSAEKIANAELRLKLSNATVEMKESVQSIGTKMELTSQTLLRQAHHKERTAVVLEDQKKKLHDLIRAKDTEIQQLTEQIERLRNDLSETSKRNEQQISQLKAAREELDSSHSKERDFYDKELKRKQSIMKQEKEQLEKELEQVKQTTYQQLKKEIAELRKENMKLAKEVENYERQLHSHSKEITVHRENMEVIRMESSVALEEQKDSANKNRQMQESSLKTFYEDTIKAKNKDIEDLKHKLNEKETDLRDLIVKYNVLEKKLAALLQTQDKLRDFENKVMSLGQDTNLLKNMAEMIKSRKQK